MSITTWRKEIAKEMARTGECEADIVACTLSDDEADTEFDAGFGWPNGIPFTVWTKRRVYFPVAYDGAEWCKSVSRRVDGIPTQHIE